MKRAEEGKRKRHEQKMSAGGALLIETAPRLRCRFFSEKLIMALELRLYDEEDALPVKGQNKCFRLPIYIYRIYDDYRWTDLLKNRCRKVLFRGGPSKNYVDTVNKL